MRNSKVFLPKIPFVIGLLYPQPIKLKRIPILNKIDYHLMMICTNCKFARSRGILP